MVTIFCAGCFSPDLHGGNTSSAEGTSGDAPGSDASELDSGATEGKSPDETAGTAVCINGVGESGDECEGYDGGVGESTGLGEDTGPSQGTTNCGVSSEACGEDTLDEEDPSGDTSPDPVATIAELLVPFDVNRQDLEGPASWATQYGKSPEIVVVAEEGALAVLAQDYMGDAPGRAVMLQLSPSDLDYAVTQVREPPFLERILGFSHDEEGAYYVASAIDEDADITVANPPEGVFRENIVRVVKLGWTGEPAFDIDLDTARGAADGDAEPLINPMVAASGRLAVGGGRVALVHGINTPPDDADVRHQKAVTTHLDAASGAVLEVSSIWVSHSFDQRVLHDGESFIELHLGDAYPRHVAIARVEPDSGELAAFHIKGDLGANNTYTRLGDVVPLDGEHGALVLFSTESTTTTNPLFPDVRNFERIAGSRDLALVRLTSGFAVDTSLPDVLTVESSGEQQTNALRWLTNYQDESGGMIHAERPKLVDVGEGRYVVLWEQWTLNDNRETFDGTFGMVVDLGGEILVTPAMLTSDHLPRGDDAVAFQGHAVWVTGDRDLRALYVHHVDGELMYRRVTVE